MVVTCREGVKNGRPVLEGSKLSVVQLTELIDDGVPPEDVADSYPGVDSVEHVEQSLKWIENNSDRVERLRRRRERSKDLLAEQAQSY